MSLVHRLLNVKLHLNQLFNTFNGLKLPNVIDDFLEKTRNNLVSMILTIFWLFFCHKQLIYLLYFFKKYILENKLILGDDY